MSVKIDGCRYEKNDVMSSRLKRSRENAISGTEILISFLRDKVKTTNLCNIHSNQS